jgi:hypothetical protein
MRTSEEVIQLIKKYEIAPKWVQDARTTHSELKALVYGEGFHDLLINRIEKIEEKQRAVARRKYAIDIRDLFARILEPRNNVFSADGGDEKWLIDDSTRKEKLKEYLENFKNGKSLDEYLKDNLFQLSDIDPNGLIILNYSSDEENNLDKIYPTYKSIDDIQVYEPNGNKVKWVLFKPVKKVISKGKTIEIVKYIDKDNVFVFLKNGATYTLIEDKSYANDFKEVPAIILSNIEKVGSNERLSWLFFVQELSKKLARDRSVRVIYEFLQGFPKSWRYEQICNLCNGTGKHNSDTCKKCSGTGQLGKNDVTDDIRLALPNSKDDATIAPNVAGFVSPDLETLKHMMDGETALEDLIEYTMWGTKRVSDGKGNETATGRFIDIQPLTNKLNVFADFAQMAHNTLSDFALRLADPLKDDKKVYNVVYGRRFIIESPDVLMEKYGKARKEGQPITVLDKMLSEVIMSKYKNDIAMRSLMLKKSKVEPYVHLTTIEVNSIFGKVEANKKVVFDEFWMQSNKDKNIEELKDDFLEWFNLNNKINEQSKNDDGGDVVS